MRFFLCIAIIFLTGCKGIREHTHNICDFSNSNDSLYNVVIPETSLECRGVFVIGSDKVLKYNDLNQVKKSDFYGLCKARQLGKNTFFNLLLFIRKAEDRKPPEFFEPYDFLLFHAYKTIESREFASAFNIQQWIDPRYPVLIGELYFGRDCSRP